MRPGLTIGEFAQVTHLSVRTLRRYHERGLLEPAVVVPASGYRYYTSEQIPAAQVELAVTVHSGPHDDIDVTYGRLGAYITGHALAIDGTVHETYLRGPRDDPDPNSWRTEIGWPIFRVAPG